MPAEISPGELADVAEHHDVDVRVDDPRDAVEHLGQEQAVHRRERDPGRDPRGAAVRAVADLVARQERDREVRKRVGEPFLICRRQAAAEDPEAKRS